MSKSNDILVTCICITYNHKNFINKCLDGMLMQKTTFPYEIIVYDDCSTDGTREIVKEYAAKYPEKIRTVLPEENQYSKIGDIVREVYVHPLVRGKYVALCEGDDYWTKPSKLQIQAEFLETNPEYSVCFHTFRNHNIYTDEYFETAPTKLLEERNATDGIDIDLKTYFNGWFTQPLTMMYRFSSFSFDWQRQYKYYRDMHEIFHYILNGKCRLMNFDGGVRNVHEGGVASMISLKSNIDVGVRLSKELFQHNKSVETKKYYCKNLQWKIYNTPRMNRLGDALTLFFLDFDFVQLIRNIKR